MTCVLLSFLQPSDLRKHRRRVAVSLQTQVELRCFFCLAVASVTEFVPPPVSRGSGQGHYQVWDVAPLFTSQFTARNQFRPIHRQSRGWPRVKLHSHRHVPPTSLYRYILEFLIHRKQGPPWHNESFIERFSWSEVVFPLMCKDDTAEPEVALQRFNSTMNVCLLDTHLAYLVSASRRKVSSRLLADCLGRRKRVDWNRRQAGMDSLYQP